MLTHNLWLCHHKRSLSDDFIDGDYLLVVLPDQGCMISIVPFRSGPYSKVKVRAYGIWYECVSEHELRISLATPRGFNWKQALYREDNDFMQWFEPREPQNYNMYCERLSWDDLKDEYLEQFEITLDRIKKIRSQIEFKDTT